MSSLILRRRAVLRGSALKIVRPAAFVAAGVCGLPDGPYGDLLDRDNRDEDHKYARWLAYEICCDISREQSPDLMLALWLEPGKPKRGPAIKPDESLMRRLRQLAYEIACEVDVSDRDLTSLMPSVHMWIRRNWND